MFDSCDPSETWDWTAKGSLRYKKKYCVRPETGWANPANDVKLVLDQDCDRSQNFFKFVPSKYEAM